MNPERNISGPPTARTKPEKHLLRGRGKGGQVAFTTATKRVGATRPPHGPQWRPQAQTDRGHRPGGPQLWASSMPAAPLRAPSPSRRRRAWDQQGPLPSKRGLGWAACERAPVQQDTSSAHTAGVHTRPANGIKGVPHSMRVSTGLMSPRCLPHAKC